MPSNEPRSLVYCALIAAAATIVTVGACAQSHAASVGEAEVRQCAEGLFRLAANGQCGNYFSLVAVHKVDARETSGEANVIADIDFQVKQRLGGSSSGASQCTGNSWKIEVKNPHPPNTAQWLMFQSQGDLNGGYLEPGRGLRVRKNFKFEKWDSGWRCAESSMSPLMLVWDDIKVGPVASVKKDSSPNANSSTAGKDQVASKDLLTFDCTRSDKPQVTTKLVVDLANRTVKSLNGFGGIGGAGVAAEISDAKISWRTSQKQNYGLRQTMTFAGNIDRASREFRFTGADNHTYLFNCR